MHTYGSFYHIWYVTVDICSILTPLQAIGILIWYVVREIVENEEEKWYKFSRASLIMVLTQVRNYCVHVVVAVCILN